MLIERTCPFTGKQKSMEIPVTETQLANWEAGELIQNAMPNLTPLQREFIKTGITDDVWESVTNPSGHSDQQTPLNQPTS